MTVLHLADEAATQALGKVLAEFAGDLNMLWLDGDLGAGKTTLTRSMLRALGHQGSVKSPTFTLVEPYEIDGRTVSHFDLYRLADPEELEYMGFVDYLESDALIIIEWPEKAAGYLPEPDLELRLRHEQDARVVEFVPYSSVAHKIVNKIANLL